MQYGDLILSALGWSTLAVVISQIVSLIVMAILGLPARRIPHAIEETQNPGIGALYFAVSLFTAQWVSLLSSDGVPQPAPALESALWIAGGVLLATIYTMILFWIAHRVMGRKAGESVYGWIRREVMQEQNAALALFLGGLAAAPFMSVLYQIF